MVIYELIYYWDDNCYGTDLGDTVLLTDIEEVNKRINEFKEQSCLENPVSSNGGNELEPYTGKWFSYAYENSGTSNLTVRTHNI